MSASRAIVVAGMHRSGTSLLAGLLADAGVDMGARLLGPGPGNPRGHFEDLDFLGFHRRLLLVRGLTPFTLPAGEVRLTGAEREEARALVDARRGVWGFKDPRALAVLPEWHELLPDPFYVLLYRDPASVARSLMARATDPEILADPAVAIAAWCDASRRTIAFHETHADRALLWNIAGVAGDLATHVAALDARLGLGRAAGGRFQPGELGAAIPAAAWRAALPKAAELFDQLERRADVPGDAAAQDFARLADLLAKLHGGEVTEERRHELAALALGREALEREAALDRVSAENRTLRQDLDRVLAETERLRAHLAATTGGTLSERLWRALLGR